MFVLVRFTKLAAENVAKQGISKCHPNKSLKNNPRSVVRGHPP